MLERAVADIGEVGLITIDPITAYMGAKLDSHKTTEVRSQLGPLKDFAERLTSRFRLSPIHQRARGKRPSTTSSEVKHSLPPGGLGTCVSRR